MKKRIALVSALLVACGGASLTEGLTEPISVHDAQFVSGPLPGTSPEGEIASPRATSVTTEATALFPSLSGVTFSGWATLDAVSVAAQIEGLGSGHWVVPTGPADPAVQGEPVRVWQFAADLHASLPPGRHRLVVAATDSNGKTGSQVATSLCVRRTIPDNGNACDPAKAPPPVVVSLAWDTPVDLDLVVVAPDGEVIASRSPVKGLSSDRTIDRNDVGGAEPGVVFLEGDTNANCRIDGRQRENVVFAATPKSGSYLVYVNLHDACGQKSVRYTLTRHVPVGVAPSFGVEEVDRKVGTLTAFHANGSASIGTFVTEFAVP